MNSKFGQVSRSSFADNEIHPLVDSEIIMNVAVIEREPATIAYLRFLGLYGEPILRFWQETFMPWVAMNELGPSHARYGIYHVDPSATASAECKYDACIEVPAGFEVNGGAFKSSIPGGKYAVLACRGSVERISRVWGALLRVWLPSSGFQLDNRPCFEHYPIDSAGDTSESGEFECEICIPVAPLRR